MIKLKDLIKESKYRFDNSDIHTTDVYYGNVLLGSLKETDDGKYKIDLVKSPMGEYFPAEFLMEDEENSFYDTETASEVLHELWKHLRKHRPDIKGNW